MHKQFIFQGPVSIEDVQYQFENWRETREKRCPIPEELWYAAVRLTEDYSVSHVARTLRLNYTRLKDRVTDFQMDIVKEDAETYLPSTIIKGKYNSSSNDICEANKKNQSVCVAFNNKEGQQFKHPEILSSPERQLSFPSISAVSQWESEMQISLIVPGHPSLGIFKYFGTVALKFGNIDERVGIVELACMDQTHKQITNVSSMLCFIKQGVFPMHDSTFDYLLTQIVIQRSAGNFQEHGQLSPVIYHVRTCFANAGIRLNLLLLQLLMEPLLKIVHQRTAFFLMQHETQFR